jgi:hypothetical protein
MKLEKPKKTKIKWHGQDIIMPYAASVYDTIIGAEQFEGYEVMQAGLDWFRQHFPKQYMVVLD